VGEGSLPLEPLLAIGDRAVVVAGPVEADGYQWYFVRPHSRGDTELPSGWVSHAGKDGEQWLAPALVPDSIAVTVEDQIRVRSAPGLGADSEPLEPLLDRREYLLVLRGPVEADGYTWYEVLSPGVQNNCWPATGVPRLLLFNADLLTLCPGMLGGWVASASKDGAPWLVPGGVRCPEPSSSGTTTLAEVTSKQGYALAIVCFGDTTLTFSATRHLRCWGSRAAWPMEPDWLNDSGIVEVLQDGGRDLFAAPHPDGLALADCNGRDSRYRIQGHFDDQDARSCRIRLDFSADAPEFDHRTSEYWCRTTFVVTRRDPGETADRTTPTGPPNDNPPGIVISSLPFTHSTDTTGAQIHADEPNSTCILLGSESVWYYLTPSADLTLTADTFGSDYDTVIDVFQGSLSSDLGDPGFDDLTALTCNDNSGGSLQSQVVFATVPGEGYVIRVNNPLEVFGGALTFHLSAVEQ
jgi:hypothetical protein